MNSTFLALIPKKEGANSFDLFRPIALCNVVYLIISKLFAKRLKKFLDWLKSEERRGFVARRQIVDGVVIAEDILHSMGTSKEKAMFIKFGMAKAYDSVKWDFFQKIIYAFGFDHDWIRYVMSCVTFLSFFVPINCEPTSLFGASRGLW